MVKSIDSHAWHQIPGCCEILDKLLLNPLCLSFLIFKMGETKGLS